MSASLVTVVPDPSKAHLHGGRFGPEGGPLAALAYVVGIAMLFWIYGGPWRGIETWALRLEVEAAATAVASDPGSYGSF